MPAVLLRACLLRKRSLESLHSPQRQQTCRCPGSSHQSCPSFPSQRSCHTHPLCHSPASTEKAACEPLLSLMGVPCQGTRWTHWMPENAERTPDLSAACMCARTANADPSPLTATRCQWDMQACWCPIRGHAARWRFWGGMGVTTKTPDESLSHRMLSPVTLWLPLAVP